MVPAAMPIMGRRCTVAEVAAMAKKTPRFIAKPSELAARNISHCLIAEPLPWPLKVQIRCSPQFALAAMK